VFIVVVVTILIICPTQMTLQNRPKIFNHNPMVNLLWLDCCAHLRYQRMSLAGNKWKKYLFPSSFFPGHCTSLYLDWVRTAQNSLSIWLPSSLVLPVFINDILLDVQCT
jgi:hypothetical protein